MLGATSLSEICFDFHGEDTAHSTHRMHPYPAKYIPQIPRALIAALSAPGDTVSDVFSGSGTSLVEAALAGRRAVGVDANPLACLIARAKTTVLTPAGEAELLELLDAVARLTPRAEGASWSSRHWRPEGDYLSFWFDTFVVEELAEVVGRCNAVVDAGARTVALTAASSIVVAVSRQDSDTRYVRRDKGLRPGDTVRRFARALRNAVTCALDFRAAVADRPAEVAVHHADSTTWLPDDVADLMVCSPPYPNAYSYHLYHQTRMLWLGLDQATFKRVEIGSHRKYSSRGPNRCTPETFAREMDAVFGLLRSRVRRGGHACFVIGDSTVAGEQVDNALILATAGSRHGFAEVHRQLRRLQDTKKAFNPRIGRIKSETVLVLRNEGDEGRA